MSDLRGDISVAVQCLELASYAPNRPMWPIVDAITCHQRTTASTVAATDTATLARRQPRGCSLPLDVLERGRTARISTNAQIVRLIDFVVSGVMARRTASSSGSPAM